MVALSADAEIPQLLLYSLFFAFLLRSALTYFPEGSSSSLHICMHLFLSGPNRLLLAAEFFLLSLVSESCLLL
jgi:hypothetical protein